MKNEKYGYFVIYSPDDGGWYIEVSDRAGKVVWTSQVHEQKGEAIKELNQYEENNNILLVFIGSEERV